MRSPRKHRRRQRPAPRGRRPAATGRGGSGEYLRDGENCLLVPAERPDALANAVRRLAAGAELRRTLRAGGMQTAPLHTEPIFNEAVERHLREVAR